MIVRAAGYATVTTHIFDAASEYLDSDAVFAVKPSLQREIVPHAAGDPERPEGVEGEWCSLEFDFVLVPADDAREPDRPRSHRLTERRCVARRTTRTRRRSSWPSSTASTVATSTAWAGS